MGRWKRKRHNYHQTRSTSSVSSDSADGSAITSGKLPSRRGFGRLDRDRLVEYLIAYRDGARRVCSPAISDEVFGADAAVLESSDSKSSVKPPHPKPSQVSIAGKDFPVLTDEVLSRPYLALPNTLTPKQRAFVHECCIDVDLFHSGVGTDRLSRWVAISIHSDGLSYVDGLSPPQHTLLLNHCRPWYHRMDHIDVEEDNSTPTHDNIQTPAPCRSVREATRKGRESIERLIDQPGMCLRDAQDRIDFRELEAADLSSVAAPTVGHDESWLLVDTAEKMKQCADELQDANPSEIGFDLEMYNKSKYFQFTCLLQLSSSAGKDYVIDVLAPGVWDSVHLLAPLFADASICKIGHSIGGMDVKSLHRDFGIFVVNAFDTYEAAQVLRLERHGLASVCKHFGLKNSEEYRLLKDTYQNTDWRRRPLTEPMVRYARSDVHYLVELRRLMIRDLTRDLLRGDNGIDREEEARMVARALASSLRSFQQNEDEADRDHLTIDDFSNPVSDNTDEDGYFTPADTSIDGDSRSDGQQKQSVFGARELRMHLGLMRVITRSQECCLGLWRTKTEPPMRCSELLAVTKRAASGDIAWNDSHIALYIDLVTWRDSIAIQEGLLGDVVCSLELLVHVARKRPTCEMALRRIVYFLPPLFEGINGTNYIQEMLELVKTSLIQDGLDISTSDIKPYRSRNENSTSASRKRDWGEERSRGIILPEKLNGGRGSMVLVASLALVAAAALVTTVTLRRRR